MFNGNVEYLFEQYDYNGWVYNLEPGRYNIVLASSPVDNNAVAATNFLLRIRGPGINGKPDYKFTQML